MVFVVLLQGHTVGLLGEDGGPTAGALSDGVSGIESSEHHNPPEILDGLDGTAGSCKKEKDISKDGQNKVEHTNVSMGKCKLCGKSVANLKKHMKSHYPDKYQCQICTMPSVPVGLSYHEMFAGSLGSPALWRCRACGKQVTNRWHHFHIHTAQRSLCPYCPNTYSRIDTLRTHIRTKHRETLFAKDSL
ncbi:hypothetical protein M0804_012753 [Polistes exclamans]|nr:hypothetical protein M0804_012753 [Polistes exclamans]